MNRLLATFGPGKDSEDGCCDECTPKCRSRRLRTQTRDRALAFRAGLQ